MGKKKVGIILGAIAVAAAAAVGIWYFLGNSGKDSNDRVYVQKVSTIMGTATGNQNRYSGVVQPQKTVEVNADSERTVKEILVEVGDEVTEGTPLFSYDTEDLKMELEQAKLELENQDIEISNYRNQIQELTKERNAAAEGDKFEYTTQIQTLETQIKQAEYEKSSKQLEMDKIQKKVDNSEVTSKASGTIKSINNGNSPDEESSAFMTILSTGEYRIQGMANEQNVNMISSGADVIIRSRVDEDMTWTGTIDSLDTGEPSENSDDNYGGDSDSMSTSSKYPFYVVMDDADGLMLGQHVLIEMDEGQTEPKEGIWLYSGYIVREGEENSGDEGVMGDTELFSNDGDEYWDEELYSDTEYGSWDEDLYLDPESGDGDVLQNEGSYEEEDNLAQPADKIEKAAFAMPDDDDDDDDDGIKLSNPMDDAGDSSDSDSAAPASGDTGNTGGLDSLVPSSSDGNAGGLDSLVPSSGDDGDSGLDSLIPSSDGSGSSMSDSLAPSSDGFGDTDASGDLDTDSDGGTGSSVEGSNTYVWADNGKGRLEKRYVELGEYDEELDEYEIVSGLTEDDLIAWPMEGLYEGVKTVTDMEEIDYNSGLYNQEGSESLSGTEYNMDDFDMDMDNADWDTLDADDVDWDDSGDADWDDADDSDDEDTDDADWEE